MKQNLFFLPMFIVLLLGCNYKYGGLKSVTLETSGSSKFKIENVNLPSGCDASFYINISQGGYEYKTSAETSFHGTLDCNPPADVIDLQKMITVVLKVGNVRGNCGNLKVGTKLVYNGYAKSSKNEENTFYSISYSNFSISK